MKNDVKLRLGDCLELMKEIPEGSVDLILCDLPYGTTDAKWDRTVNLDILWNEYKRIIKDNGAIALFGQLPFGADLIQANKKMFRYEWVWVKSVPMGFLNANKMPLRKHENIFIFYKKLPTYNPQKTEGKPYNKGKFLDTSDIYGDRKIERPSQNSTGMRFPIDVIYCPRHSKSEGFHHSAQKPVALLEYLIKTYTNPGETVLDNCMGSGSTGVACMNTGRNFVGMELLPEYYETSIKRIMEAQQGQTEKNDKKQKETAKIEGFADNDVLKPAT